MRDITVSVAVLTIPSDFTWSSTRMVTIDATMEEINEIISAVTAKDAHELCREVMSITDTMDVLRAKWNVEILTELSQRPNVSSQWL